MASIGRKICFGVALLSTVFAFGCAHSTPGSVAPSTPSDPSDRKYSDKYGPPVKLADLTDKAINESSGIVASRNNPGIYWTHNDSGDGPFIYALDRSGHDAGVWRVAGATADDWEDIAAGPGPEAGVNYLYLGDIGDNGTDRDEVVVFRVPEPAIIPTDASSSKESPRTTEPATPIFLKYPDGKHNAEALMIHPQTGDLYIVTKERKHPAGVYRLAAADLQDPDVHILAKVAELRIPSITEGMVTGGDISPDGRRVILCDYFGAYELNLNSAAGSNFDTIWKSEMLIVNLGTRQQGEAVCYSLDGNAILATSENLPTPLIEVKRK
jgi:hypothetical protein